MYPYGFLVVLCQLSRDPPAAHFCTLNVREKCATLPCEKLNCYSNSLSNTRRLALSLLNCRDKICWCGRTPAPLFICHTHATATKFPTPFSHMLHGHHIRAINCLNFMMNFNWSCLFSPQKPNNWSNLFLCPHTHSTVPIAELRRPRKLRSLIYESASI